MHISRYYLCKHAERYGYNLRTLIACALISTKTSCNALTPLTPNLTSYQHKTVFVTVKDCVNDYL